MCVCELSKNDISMCTWESSATVRNSMVNKSSQYLWGHVLHCSHRRHALWRRGITGEHRSKPVKKENCVQTEELKFASSSWDAISLITDSTSKELGIWNRFSSLLDRQTGLLYTDWPTCWTVRVTATCAQVHRFQRRSSQSISSVGLRDWLDLTGLPQLWGPVWLLNVQLQGSDSGSLRFMRDNKVNN